MRDEHFARRPARVEHIVRVAWFLEGLPSGMTGRRLRKTPFKDEFDGRELDWRYWVTLSPSRAQS
jgi:hypothetical protein